MQVRSCTLDTWLPEQVAFMERTGNAVANAHREARLQPGDRPSSDPLELERFIRRKVRHPMRPHLQRDLRLASRLVGPCLGCSGAASQLLAWLGSARAAARRPPRCSATERARSVPVPPSTPHAQRLLQYNGDFAEGAWPPAEAVAVQRRSSDARPFQLAVGAARLAVHVGCS